MRNIKETFYLAGPMTGYPNWNYETFNCVAQIMRQNGARVLNPADIGVIEGWDCDDYWPINKAMLMGADTIVMLPGWEKSMGAKRELEFAKELGLGILKVELVDVEDEDV